ncbi:DUF5068 domain-containing protein [Bacillus sp. RAR_GA_16]|uniref:DUF5068 domain-containing protein n=1 Tax=Bacillus sp. RAR_GA_16 TaxID=2876774 RepID=UPI001CCCEC05|nr:DUF5068 domain-containing protein [Bacillus sp. RAR_GA_16]MCA0171419.1 DUF5068 domain-containing protein [Bacillus sp. RAR_GA_16]
MKVRSIFLTGVIAMLLLTVACGSNEEQASTDASEDSKSEENQSKDEKAEETKSDQKETEESISETTSGEIMNPNIAEESQGDVEEVYTSEENLDYVHDMDGFKVSIDQYQIVKVTDMSEDMYIQFDDQTDGYVVTAKVTIDNTRDKAIYYPSYIRIQGVNEGDFLSSEKTFVRDQYPKSKVEDEPSKFGAGEKVSGLVTFTLTNDQYDVMTDVKPKFVIEGGAADNDQFKDSFKGNATFDLIYGEEQKAEVESEAGLYPDQLTTGNMADKEMIFEKSGIDKTKQLGDVEVTLNGVQYAEIKPTAGNEERFSNFGDVGIVAVTVKLTLNNQSDMPINTFLLSSHLLIDGDRGSVLSQSMVEPREPKEIEAGETGEKYHVFMFRKDDFDSMKKFELDFGPFVGEDGKDLYKGKTVTFSLPR